ncbi:zinc finger protein 761-like [Oppia nitens]|uniref:zinc finger protein 761-like n=1 Tax=Oppia nitens TaxID=1686743 RepID=UPI0023DB553F|nr:zinc finger protein 761-like [Oppia nitens]
MNQSNYNIRHTRLGRHKTQDMSVTIDVNDVFEEVVKQNERLVKEIEFYEEVVNDLITNVKTCIVCQQNDVLNDRINRLEKYLKSKSIDNSTDFKSECNKKLKTNVKTKTLKNRRNTKKRRVEDVTDIDSYEPTDMTSDDNESDISWTTNVKTKTSKKTRNTTKRRVEDLDDINNSEPNDETLDYPKPRDTLKVESLINNDYKITKTKVKIRSVRKPRAKPKRRLEDSSESDYESDGEQLPELISDDKPYSLEYEMQRDLLKDKTRIIGIGSGYRCQSCIYQNSEFRALEKHINRHHLKIKPFKCRVCCIGFYCLSDCIQHLRKQHNIVSDAIKMSNTYNNYDVIDETITDEKPYSDEYVEQLRALKASSRKSDGRYHCKDCEYHSSEFVGFESHVNRHHLKITPYKCHLCPNRYTGRHILNKHKKDGHKHTRDSKLLPTQSFKCSYCDDYTAISLGKLEQHITRTHLHVKFDTKEVKCTTCGKSYSSENSLRTHRHISHGVGRNLIYIKCDWPGCSFKTHNKSLLITHHKRHIGAKEFACEWPGCDYRSITKIDMNRHSGSVHTQLRQYPCQWPGCDYSGKIERHLQQHTQRAHEDRPYAHVCDWPECGKKFRFKNLLTRHMELHNEPHIPCSVCGKLFKSKKYLKDHMQSHTGRKSVMCPVFGCNTRISCKPNLKSHLRVHHKDWSGN